MFQEWFETMHEILDEVITEYPHASIQQRHQLNEQVDMLQELSMDCCEHWLAFEEKLAQWKEQALEEVEVESVDPLTLTEEFQKGEGYFILLMYDEAYRYFQQITKQHPDFYLAQVYAGICLLEMRQLEEASRHLSLVISLANDERTKAIALHGMGCVLVQKNHLNQACEYFKLARQTDPTLSYYSLS